jgi:predicted RNA methylase
MRDCDDFARSLLGDPSQALENSRVLAAFERYFELLNAGDRQAQQVNGYLANRYQAPLGEPYFLESLERASRRQQRRGRGVFYTPWPIAAWIVRRVAELCPAGPLTIVDPACGSGVFLLAAASLLQGRSKLRLIGFDICPAAVGACRTLLSARGVEHAVECLDVLAAGPGLLESVPITGTLVIVGNPPYSNFGAKRGRAANSELLAAYRRDVRERKFNLSDQFIQFLRWGQQTIDAAGRGVLAMVTNRTYLDGLTHRGMRRSLCESFESIEIVDLLGDEQGNDENVFGIRRGVAIGVFHKGLGSRSQRTYVALRGARAAKLDALSAGTLPPRVPLTTTAPHRQLMSMVNGSAPLGANRSAPWTSALGPYETWPSIVDIFPLYGSGVQTKHDALFTDASREALQERMKRYCAEQSQEYSPSAVLPYLTSPWDRRWIYYDPALLGRPRWRVMRHIIERRGNLALAFMRQSCSAAEYDHALVVDCLASDRLFYSRRGAPFLAPLSLRDGTANLSEHWLRTIGEKLARQPSVESQLGYVYAVLFSRSYRKAFHAELSSDFPRIPPPIGSDGFAALSSLGQRLMALHLKPLDAVEVPPEGEKSSNATPALHVGGRPVVAHWLKARRKSAPTKELAAQAAALICIAKGTLGLMDEIDQALNDTVIGRTP